LYGLKGQKHDAQIPYHSYLPYKIHLHKKAISLQAWAGPESSRRLRLSDFKIAHEGGKVVNPPHWPSVPPRKYSWYSFLLEAVLTLGPQCGWKDYVNEKCQ